LKNMLQEVAAKKPPPQWTPLLRSKIAVGLACAMMHLHAHEAIHRHLAPQHIRFNEEWNPKLVDFAYSKACVDNTGMSTIDATGSEEYVAPEALMNEKYDWEVDVFAYGMILYQLVTGQVVWPGVARTGIPQKILNGDRPPIPDDVRISLRVLITACWAQNPRDRPRFAQIVKIFCDESPILPLTDADRREYHSYRDLVYKTAKVIGRDRTFFEHPPIRQSDREEWLRCYEDARKGIHSAEYDVGWFLSIGFGTRKNMEQAIIFMKRAADSGDIQAMYNLGRWYGRGEGVPASPTESAQWLKKASDAGLPLGMLKYSGLLIEGKGVRRNVSEAVKILMRISKSTKNPVRGEADFRLAKLHQTGVVNPSDPDLHLARRYYEEAYKKGWSPAKYCLAVMMLRGDGGPKDVPNGLAMLEQDAEQSGVAAHDLGVIHEKGDYGRPKNLDTALDYYKTAGTLAHSGAMIRACSILWGQADAIRGTDAAKAAELDTEGRELIENAATLLGNKNSLDGVFLDFNSEFIVIILLL
jgi:TPR repeat protein